MEIKRYSTYDSVVGIKRWNEGHWETPSGEYVLYADYLAEVEALKATIKRLEQEVKDAFHKGESRGYQRGKGIGYSWRV